MANMSYCRFRNTVIDLGECLEVMEALYYGEDANGDPVEALDLEEDRARERLERMMVNALRNMGYEVTENDNDYDDEDEDED